MRQLPDKDKAKPSKKLTKEAVGKRLSGLLSSFRTDDIREEEITAVVETIRAELFAGKEKG